MRSCHIPVPFAPCRGVRSLVDQYHHHLRTGVVRAQTGTVNEHSHPYCKEQIKIDASPCVHPSHPIYGPRTRSGCYRPSHSTGPRLGHPVLPTEYRGMSPTDWLPRDGLICTSIVAQDSSTGARVSWSGLFLPSSVEILCRGDALHVGAQLVHRLQPLLVLVRVEDDAAACEARQ